MLSVFETGEATFRLSDARDESVGWIRGNAVGFDGFEDEAHAIEGALTGSDALRAHLERLSGASLPAATARGRVRVVHDGAYEWVSRGTVPLARLFRPARDVGVPSRRGHAVEFLLPSYVKAGSVISAAQVVHNALARAPRPPVAVAAEREDTAALPCDLPTRATLDVARTGRALAGAEGAVRRAAAH